MDDASGAQNEQIEVVSAQVVQRQQPAPAPRRGGFGRRLLIFLLLLAVPFLILFGLVVSFAGSLTAGSDTLIEKRFEPRRWKGDKKVAILKIEGTIISGQGFVKQQIDQIIQDEDVVAVVVRVNSPGGTITGSDYILHHLKQMRKERTTGGKPLPLVVSMGAIAASGGYYVAMAVEDTPQSIYAEPSTWTGSIGVIIPHYDFSGLMKQWDVEEDSITSHRLKGMGSMTRPMTEEEEVILQELVDESFGRFKQIILSGRPDLDDAKLEELATGQVFTTTQAMQSGLVDKQGFIDDAIVRAIQLAGLTEEDVSVVQYKKQPSLTELLMVKAQPRSELELLLELTTPRAYYLCTWLPAMSSSSPRP